MKLSVVCEGEVPHAATAMEPRPWDLTYHCSVCAACVTDQAVRRAVPSSYWPSSEPIGRALQEMADYDLRVIFRGHRARVEYPRPSLDEQP